MKPHVYFAGKIGKNDWRHSIVPGLRSALYEDGPFDVGAYIYNGPFFISCDHGCNHGPTTHGVFSARSSLSDPCYEPFEGAQPDRHEIARRAIEGVRMSQLVFAYVNAPDCIGSIFEIGIAVQMRKPVALCIDASVDEREFWLLSHSGGVTTFSGIAEGDLPALLCSQLVALQLRAGNHANENRIFEAIEVMLT
jgi:hypothetical protein